MHFDVRVQAFEETISNRVQGESREVFAMLKREYVNPGTAPG